jgi:FkbM family methyltransferase
MKIPARHLSTKGISLKIPDVSSFFLYFFSTWEPELQYFIDNYIGDGDVLEIGAHIGYETLYLAERVRKDKRVIAFEPSPKTQIFLKTNCIPFKNIEIIGKAVSDKSGQTEMQTYTLFSAWNTLGKKGRFPEFMESLLSPQKNIISQTTIDDFLSSRNELKPSFIKIDAENYEYQVLRGGEKTLSKYRPVITFEGGDLNRSPRYSTKKIIELLGTHGYKFYAYERQLNRITSNLPKDFSKTINVLALPC